MALKAEMVGFTEAPKLALVPDQEVIEHPRDEGVFVHKVVIDDSLPTYLARGQVEVGKDEVSWTLQIPEKISYNGLVMFVSGFGATEQTSRPFQRASARAGTATVTFSPARKSGKKAWQRVNDPQELHVETMSAVVNSLRSSSQTSQHVRNRRGIDLDRLRLVAHSMGGESAIKFAELHPDVESVTNLATVGFGSPTLAELAERLPKGILPGLMHELIPAIINGDINISWANLKDFLRHNFIDPLQTASEALSCLTYDAKPATQRLRDIGVKVGYIAFEHDILVPNNPQTAEHVDDYTVMARAGHLAPQCKASRVIQEVEAQLFRLSLDA